MLRAARKAEYLARWKAMTSADLTESHSVDSKDALKDEPREKMRAPMMVVWTVDKLATQLAG